MIYYHRLPFVFDLTKKDICREPIAAFFMSIYKTVRLQKRLLIFTVVIRVIIIYTLKRQKPDPQRVWPFFLSVLDKKFFVIDESCWRNSRRFFGLISYQK